MGARVRARKTPPRESEAAATRSERATAAIGATHRQFRAAARAGCLELCASDAAAREVEKQRSPTRIATATLAPQRSWSATSWRIGLIPGVLPLEVPPHDAAAVCGK